MVTLHRLIVWFTIMISPARIVAALPLTIPTVNASSAIATAPYQIILDTSKPEPVVAIAAPRPDFDADVLAPLRAAQAAEAAQKAADAARAKARQAAASVAAAAKPALTGEDAFAQLRYCEAGGDYTRNSGNGYFGAYQYSIGTWANYGGYARADLAPASVQDAKAHADVAAGGWSKWPACSRKLGL